MNLHDKLTFGRHKGKSVYEIWKGGYKTINTTNIKDFLADCVDYFFGLTDFNNKILSSNYQFSVEDTEFILKLMGKRELRKYVYINNSEIKVLLPDDYLQKYFVDFLIRYFNSSWFSSSHFTGLKHPDNNNETIEFTNPSKILAHIIPDPDYILWCKDNIDDFIINQENMDYLLDTESIYPAIVLTKKSENIINYRFLAYIGYHG